MADNTSIDVGPFSNTNIMDREAMSSPRAEMARQKSEEVMAALKKNDGSADRMMGNTRAKDNSSGGGGFRNWIKRKMGPGSAEGNGSKLEKTRGRKSEDAGGIDGLKGSSSGIGVEDSSGGIIVGDPAPKGDILARDGGKGDGVIR